MTSFPRRRALPSAIVIAFALYAVSSAVVFAQSTFPGIEGKLWKELLPWGENTGPAPANDVIWADPTDLNNVPSSLRFDTGELDHLGNVIYQSTLPVGSPGPLFGWFTMDSSFEAAQIQFDALTALGQCTFSHAADYDIDSSILFPQVRWCRGPQIGVTESSQPIYAKLPPAAGRLLNPVGLAIDGARIYVSDLFNHRIQAFDFYGRVQPMAFPIGNGEPADGTYDSGAAFPLHAGVPTSYTGHRLNSPYGLAIDGTTASAQRHLLIADSFNHRIAIFNTDGSPAFGSFASPIHATLPTPTNGTGGRLVPLDEDSAYTLFERDGVLPDQVAVSPGAVVQQPEPIGGSGSTDRIVVTDRRHCYVIIMDTAFKLIKSLPAQLPNVVQHDACQDPEVVGETPRDDEFSTVTAVKIDDNGFIYVADHSQNVVKVFDRDGNYQTSIGKPGAGNPADVKGELRGPVGLFFDKVNNVSRLGVIDEGKGRAVFYGLANGPSQTTYEFEVPTTVAVDDFPMGIDIQRGPANQGLDPKGRILVTDPIRRRVLRFELPELVIVNQTAVGGTGDFDVVVPKQKEAAVVGVDPVISVLEGAVTHSQESPAVNPTIAPGSVQHFTFTYNRNTSPTATFTIEATGDAGAAVADPVEAIDRGPCDTCLADHVVYYDPPADIEAPEEAQVFTSASRGDWYGREVFVRITPTAESSPITHIQWKRGGQAAIDYDADTHEEAINAYGWVDVLFRTHGAHSLTYRAVSGDGAGPEITVPVNVDLLPSELDFTTWQINSADVSPVVDPFGREWYRTVNGPLVGSYNVTDDASGVKLPGETGMVSFSAEGRDLVEAITLEDWVGHTKDVNSRNVTGGRWVNIDNTPPDILIPVGHVIDVPATGADTRPFAVLAAGALEVAVTDPDIAIGVPGSRPAGWSAGNVAGTYYDGDVITFTATDYAGNTSTKTATINITQLTPTVSYLSQDEVVYGSTLTMKAVVEPALATGTVQFTFDGQTLVGTLQDETVGTVTKRVATVILPNVFSDVANNPYQVDLVYSGNDALTAAMGTGAVRILKFPIRVTADNKWKYYGDDDPPLTYVSVPAQLLRPGDAFVGEIGRRAGNTVGTYLIETYQLSLNNPNYDLQFDNGLFTIVGLVTVNPRPVTMTYGDPEPSFDFDFGAFPQGSSLANITVNPTCSAAGPRTAGIHNIIQCSGAASDLGALLEFAYPKANLTVNKATPVVALTGGPFLYDGASHPASCTVTGVGTDTLTGMINYAGGATPQNAGIYATTCSFAGNANYEPASASIDVVVDPRPLTVQGGTFNISLFGLVPDLTCSLTASVTSTPACSVVSGSLVGSDTVSGVLSWDLLMQIGAHPLEQGSVTVGPVANNYEFAYVNGVLNIANSAPVAVDDAATTASPFAVDIDVLANDTDDNGDTLTITSFTQSANGSVTQVGSLLRFTPDAGFGDVATFTYTIGDGRGGSDTATVTVNVTPNSVPDARNDNASTTSPTPVDVAVLANDVDADGDTLTISSFTQPATGSVTQVGSSLQYTPPAGFGGVVTFTYTISDGRGGSDTATVTITVNAPPDAADDTATTRAGVAVVVAVLGNDTDVDGDTLSVSSFTQPTVGGTVTQVGSTLSFMPAPGFSATASFTYTISDGRGGTDTATVTIDVTANTPPVALDDSTSTVSPSAVDINVLANDSDANGDTLTLTSVTQPTIGGSTTIVAGKVRFTPTPGFTGPATFTYTIDDGMGGSATATVIVNVSAPINNAPVALDDAAATSGAAPVDINVLANDSDIDGDALTISAFTQPATGGTVTTSGSLLKFTPAPGFVGIATFTYTISDGKGGTDTATVTVTVSSAVCTLDGFTTYTQGGWGANPRGNNPAALLASKFSTVYPGGFVSIGGNRTLTFTSPSAVQAFLPAGGTAGMLISSATNPTWSSAGVFAGQVLALQLNVDFSRAGITKPGLGELLYMGYPVSTILAAANQVLGGDPAILDEIDLNISELNAIVDAINNNFDNGTSNDGVLTCPNGTCAAGTLSLNGGWSSTSGTAGNIRTFNGNGVSVKVSGFSRVKTTGAWSTAFLGAYGPYGLGVTDSSEGSGSSNQHKVDNLGDRNNYMLFEFSSPVVVTKAWLDYIGADGDATIWLGNVTDPYDNHLTLSDALLASLGAPQSSTSTSTADRWATFNAGSVAVNVLVIAADVNDTTPDDQFKIAKLDITCASSESNSAPTISLEDRTNAKDASVSLQVTGEDSDEDDVLTYSASGLPPGLSMSTSGLVTGTATTAGSYTVTVTVTDASNATGSATFTWTITAANHAPDAKNDSVTATKNTTRTIAVLSNDTDPDGDDLTVTSFVVPASSVGTVTLLSDGRFSYKPKKNYTGSFSFSYTVSDGRGGSDSATVTVQVKSSHSSGDGCNHD